jgi:CRISPR-associated endoribonuclease Cas6
MRLIISIKMQNNNIPFDYRPSIMSLFKKVLSRYNDNFFNETYDKNNPQTKDFCYSIFFNKPKYINNTIEIGNNIFQIVISSFNHSSIVFLYNSFIKFKDYFNMGKDNKGKVINCKLVPLVKVEGEEMKIKLLSPLLIRKHNKENNKDFYLKYDSEEFEQIFNVHVSSICSLHNIKYEEIKIISIYPKSTLIKNMDSFLLANLGIYKLTGPNNILNLLYRSGIGARRGEGFGMFEIADD